MYCRSCIDIRGRKTGVPFGGSFTLSMISEKRGRTQRNTFLRKFKDYKRKRWLLFYFQEKDKYRFETAVYQCRWVVFVVFKKKFKPFYSIWFIDGTCKKGNNLISLHIDCSESSLFVHAAMYISHATQIILASYQCTYYTIIADQSYLYFRSLNTKQKCQHNFESLLNVPVEIRTPFPIHSIKTYSDTVPIET